jgi:hypothetical protein
MTFFGIIKRLREESGLAVSLEDGALKIESWLDLYPSFEFTKNGMRIKCHMGQTANQTLLTWEEIEFIKKGFTK